MSWRLDIGANIHGEQVDFYTWAPFCEKLHVQVLKEGFSSPLEMTKDPRGYFSLSVEGIGEGDLYYYLLPNGDTRPDPVSRSQPEGVHGPSQIVNPKSFSWHDHPWEGIPLSELIFYECHVGTFTEQGTFAGVIEKLPYLKELGVNCLEIMPVGQFPGRWNWGYDGTCIYAPQNTYGGPQGLKELVDAAHKMGIAVCLDVIYNHFGPEGNYWCEFGPYLSNRHVTPWGKALNYDGPQSEPLRHFIIQNALYWIVEYHIDVLRLDAIHGIFDFSARHILEELHDNVEELTKEFRRNIHLIPESDLNDSRFIRKKAKGGCGLNGQWLDDYHHGLHVELTGEQQDYYVDFSGIEDLVASLKKGYVYDGQYSTFREKEHGNSSADLPPEQFVVFSQNHDQVGNRPLGNRLSTQISFSAQKMSACLLLLGPYLPLLFMGQEYGEKAPFPFFVDFSEAELMQAVYESKRKEADSHADDLLYPGEEAYRAAHLRWNLDQEQEKALLTLHRDLISLRKALPLFKHLKRKEIELYSSIEKNWLALEYSHNGSPAMRLFCYFGKTPLKISLPFTSRGEWSLFLHTEQEPYNSSNPLHFDLEKNTIEIPPESALVFLPKN